MFRLMLPNAKSATSDPLDFKYHRQVGKPGPAQTYPFYSHGPVEDGVEVYTVVPIAGQLFVRLRGKLTVAGTLTFKYLRPGAVRSGSDLAAASDDGYDTSLEPPHADVAVVADTEFLVDIEPGGESDLRIGFTPDDDTEDVGFLDVMYQ